MLRLLASLLRWRSKVMASTLPARPLIVILGQTGTGKSKLAVELARKHHGEIINADAMQMYRGLPIVTNKITEDEKKDIKHHLLDLVDLNEKPWTVHDFVRKASETIDDIRRRGKLPIVVGGTSYYVYSLLFPDQLVTESKRPGSYSEGEISDVEEIDDQPRERRHDDAHQENLAICDGTNEQLYARLMNIDPVAAHSWHPNEHRKLQRALQIWSTTGKKPSDIYAEQEANKTLANATPSSLSNHTPLIFWLSAQKDVLRRRLDDRVDTMLQQGLLDEVKMMRRIEHSFKARNVDLDQTRGIWVSIGYKELRPWLDMLEQRSTTIDNEYDESSSKSLGEGVKAVKAATRRYANTQEHWLRGRLAKALKRAGMLDRLFVLDCTDIDVWQDSIFTPSSDLVVKFLAGHRLPDNASLSELANDLFVKLEEAGNSERRAHICESCKVTLMSEEEWLRHLKSRKHQKVLDGVRKRAKRDEYLTMHQSAAHAQQPIEPP